MGFKDCCEEYGDLNLTYLTEPGDSEYSHFDKKELIRFLSEINEHVAIMCANDPIALFIYEYCEKKQYKNR